MIRYLGVDELETDTHIDVRVAWVGEEGDAIAFTHDSALGLAAILAMARRDLGGECTPCGAVQQVWMRFYVPDGHQADEWQGERCGENADGALRVVFAEGLASKREMMLDERARLLRENPDIKYAAELAPLMGEHYGEYWWWVANRDESAAAR